MLLSKNFSPQELQEVSLSGTLICSLFLLFFLKVLASSCTTVFSFEHNTWASENFLSGQCMMLSDGGALLFGCRRYTHFGKETSRSAIRSVPSVPTARIMDESRSLLEFDIG